MSESDLTETEQELLAIAEKDVAERYGVRRESWADKEIQKHQPIRQTWNPATASWEHASDGGAQFDDLDDEDDPEPWREHERAVQMVVTVITPVDNDELDRLAEHIASVLDDEAVDCIAMADHADWLGDGDDEVPMLTQVVKVELV